MKRIFLITILLVLASFGLIAAPGNIGSVALNLDLSSTTIEKIGFDEDVPPISLTTLPNHSYLETSTSSIDIEFDAEKGVSVEKTFYIWWYLYTVNEFSIKCNATTWKGTENSDVIAFNATFKKSDGDEIDKLAITEDTTASDVLVYKHINDNTGLNVGYASITIPSFSYLGKAKDTYSTTISFTFTTI